jgi:leucyl-tRNA synthetase
MTMLNVFEKEKGVPRQAYETFIKLLHPYAPHMTSELAEMHNIELGVWPAYDEAKLATAVAQVVVQINGKVRATIELSPSASETEALTAARLAAGKWLTGPEKSHIYVPGRVVNLLM